MEPLTSKEIPSASPRTRERASFREAVGKKIRKEHQLVEGEIVSPSLLAHIDKACDQHFKGEAWAERCRECAGHSGITMTPQLQAATDTVALKVTHQMIESLAYRKAMQQHRPSSPFYRQDDIKESLENLHTNHTTREALSSFQDLGYSERSALSLTGNLIQLAILEMPCRNVPYEIQPQMRNIGSMESFLERVNSSFWREERDYIRDAWREDKGSMSR